MELGRSYHGSMVQLFSRFNWCFMPVYSCPGRKYCVDSDTGTGMLMAESTMVLQSCWNSNRYPKVIEIQRTWDHCWAKTHTTGSCTEAAIRANAGPTKEAAEYQHHRPRHTEKCRGKQMPRNLYWALGWGISETCPTRPVRQMALL